MVRRGARGRLTSRKELDALLRPVPSQAVIDWLDAQVPTTLYLGTVGLAELLTGVIVQSRRPRPSMASWSPPGTFATFGRGSLQRCLLHDDHERVPRRRGLPAMPERRDDRARRVQRLRARLGRGSRVRSLWSRLSGAAEARAREALQRVRCAARLRRLDHERHRSAPSAGRRRRTSAVQASSDGGLRSCERVYAAWILRP